MKTIYSAFVAGVLLIACQTGSDRPPDSDASAAGASTLDDGGDLPDGEVSKEPADGSAPISNTTTSALYAGICVTALAAGDPEQALRFYTEVQYAAQEAKLTITITPLIGWDVPGKIPITPITISEQQKRGARISRSVTGVANGQFTIAYGTLNLAEEANSISGRAAVIENFTFDGFYSSTAPRFCARMSGQLTIPYAFPFKAAENTCVFQKVNDGDPMPKIPTAEFVCDN